MITRSVSTQTDGPDPEERARSDTKSLAIRVYPGHPGWLVQIVERKDASDTQADSGEACFGSGGVCMLASLCQNRGGCSVQGTHNWLPSGTHDDNVTPINLRVTGLPKRDINPSHSPKR
jgi:hypothetical protein